MCGEDLAEHYVDTTLGRARDGHQTTGVTTVEALDERLMRIRGDLS
jgi:hypothetical protein